MNDCSTLLAIICYISLSQTNILFAFVLFCCCFLEADQEEDESKKETSSADMWSMRREWLSL